jgi:excisionase family DNA binding protein
LTSGVPGVSNSWDFFVSHSIIYPRIFLQGEVMTVQGSKRDDSTHLRFYTVAETASILRLSRKSVYDLINGMQLPAIRLGQRQLRISTEDLEAFIEQRRTATSSAAQPDEQSEAPDDDQD